MPKNTDKEPNLQIKLGEIYFSKCSMQNKTPGIQETKVSRLKKYVKYFLLITV